MSASRRLILSAIAGQSQRLKRMSESRDDPEGSVRSGSLMSSPRHNPEEAKAVPMMAADLPPEVPGDPPKRTQKQALSALRFFMRRFVRFHRARLRSEVTAVKTRCLEILWYLVFCALVVMGSVITRQDQDYFWLGHSIKSQLAGEEFPPELTPWLKTFEDIEKLEDYYSWMVGPFWGTMYDPTQTWWGGFAPLNDSASYQGLLFGTNTLIGGIKVAQLREIIREDADCPSPFTFTDPSKKVMCYASDDASFLELYETKAAAGIPEGIYPWAGSNQTLMPYSVVEERLKAGLATFRSDAGRVYPAPAYPLMLPNHNGTQAMTILNGIWQNGYIDRQSRVVLITFTMYSPNLDQYTMVDIVMENTKVGSVSASIEVTSERLGTVWEARNDAAFVIEILVILFYLWYTVQEVRRTMAMGFQRLLRFSTVAHDLNILVYIVYWTFKITAFYAIPTNVVADTDNYYDFRPAIRLREMSRLANAGNVWIIIFKLLAYSSIIPSFSLLTRTIGNAVGPTLSFLLISAILLYGFSSAYMIALGPRAFSYRNLTASATSLLRSLLGDFDYEEIRQGHYVIGPFLFVL
jgi:hypothetical protein